MNQSTGPPGLLTLLAKNLAHAGAVSFILPIALLVTLKVMIVTSVIEDRLGKSSFHPPPNKEVKALVVPRSQDKQSEAETFL